MSTANPQNRSEPFRLTLGIPVTLAELDHRDSLLRSRFAAVVWQPSAAAAATADVAVTKAADVVVHVERHGKQGGTGQLEVHMAASLQPPGIKIVLTSRFGLYGIANCNNRRLHVTSP